MRVPQVSERIKEAPAQALRGVFAGIGQLLLITDKLRNKAPYRDTRAPQAEKANGTTAAPAGATVTPDVAAGAGAVTAEPATAEPAAAEPAAAEPAAAAQEAARPAAAETGTTEAVVTDGVATEAAPVKAAPAKAAPAKATPAKRTAAKPAAAKPAAARGTAAKAAPAEPAAERPKPPKRQSARDFDKTGNVRLLREESGSPGPAAGAPAPAAAADPVTGAGPVAAPLPDYDGLSVASLRARLRNLDVTQVRGLADYERAHAARADVLAMYERRIAKLEAGA